MDRIGMQPMVAIKVSVTIDTLLNFEGDVNGHTDADVTCKYCHDGVDTVKL